MKRNPEATCATCPYWKQDIAKKGFCRRRRIVGEASRTSRDFWCGEHPDFELRDTYPEEEIRGAALTFKGARVKLGDTQTVKADWPEYREELRKRAEKAERTEDFYCERDLT